jgi:hypothetical protein
MAQFNNLERPFSTGGDNFCPAELLEPKRRASVFRETGRAFFAQTFPDRARAFAQMLERAYQAGLDAGKTGAKATGPRLISIIDLSPRPRGVLRDLAWAMGMQNPDWPFDNSSPEFLTPPTKKHIVLEDVRDGKSVCIIDRQPIRIVARSSVTQLFKLKLLVPISHKAGLAWQPSQKAIKLLLEGEVREDESELGWFE